MWEYRTVKLGGAFSGTPSDRGIEELNRLGRDDWELVEMTSMLFGPYVALMKRNVGASQS